MSLVEELATLYVCIETIPHRVKEFLIGGIERVMIRARKFGTRWIRQHLLVSVGQASLGWTRIYLWKRSGLTSQTRPTSYCFGR